MNRRNFLQQLLLATAAVATIDVDQLLWTPKSMITVPAMPGKVSISQVTFDPILTEIALRYRDKVSYAGPYRVPYAEVA